MIAEIVGVAGTGKSTIAQVVAQRSLAIQTDYRVRWRYVLPAYYARAAWILPTRLVRYRGKGKVLCSALRWMIYLEKLHDALSRLDKDGRILLDQGPVFWLTYLHAFGSDGIRDEWFTRWWDRCVSDWSSMLDIIFFLDGDDTALIRRVRNRNKIHRIQNLSDEEACAFLACYREEYGRTIAKLTAGEGPRVHYLLTDRESPDKVADQILIKLLAGHSC